MKKTSVFLLVFVLVLFAAIGGVSAKSDTHFEAHLAGSNEVPANGSQAVGQAIFRVVDDGQAIEYTVIVADLDNVMMSHIHLAPEGVNGPIVVWLYPSAPPPQLISGTTNGVLMTGRFTAANLVGPLAGHPLSDLIDAMGAGNTYVNAHTTLLPGGEIRGQIK